MREIKFRAWDGKSIYNNVVIIDGKAYLRDYFATMVEAGDYVMQYTGLKDKNGVEIYEGDVIQCVSEMVRLDTNEKTGNIKTENYEVRWEPEKARWGRFIKGRFELLSGLHKEYMIKWYAVIGNIYENPELVDK